MEKDIKLSNDFTISICKPEDYTNIVTIQNDVVEELKENGNDALFITTDDNSINEYLKREDIYFIGVKAKDQLCAYSYTLFNDDLDYSLSHNFKNKKTATFDSVIVAPQFRVNNLHSQLLKASIDEAIKNNYEIIATTVSPDNIHSLNNFIKNGFLVLRIINGEVGYEGYKRYVMYKEIGNQN